VAGNGDVATHVAKAWASAMSLGVPQDR
jgi:hypothetical protein